MTAVAYGLVQFVLEPIFYTIPQMLLDYPLAFGALGLAGFFNKKKVGTSDRLYRRRHRTFCICNDFRCCIFRSIRTGRHEPAGIFCRLSGILPCSGGNHHLDYHLHSTGYHMHLRKSANAPWKRRLRSAIKKRTVAPALCTLKRDTFYYGKQRLSRSRCNQRRQF